MSKHTSKPRNPKMAQVFYRAGFIEAWGRGYEKIMKAFDNANLKRPEFTVDQRGVTATIYREIFMSVRGDAKPNQNEPNRYRTDTNRYKTDAVRRTRCRSTDCKSPGTKARNRSVFTF